MSENRATTPTGDPTISLSARQQELQTQLSDAIGAALPWVRQVGDTIRAAQSPYRGVAKVLVVLRHEFRGANGQAYDLRGRSAPYRAVVRKAYVLAGSDPDSSISKKLTAGTAYWVRKILLTKYGEAELRRMGVISPGKSFSPASGERIAQRWIGHNGLKDLDEVVGALNVLASDPEMVPSEELVRAASRAVRILEQKLIGRKSDRFTRLAI